MTEIHFFRICVYIISYFSPACQCVCGTLAALFSHCCFTLIFCQCNARMRMKATTACRGLGHYRTAPTAPLAS